MVPDLYLYIRRGSILTRVEPYGLVENTVFSHRDFKVSTFPWYGPYVTVSYIDSKGEVSGIGIRSVPAAVDLYTPQSQLYSILRLKDQVHSSRYCTAR